MVQSAMLQKLMLIATKSLSIFYELSGSFSLLRFG